MLINVIIHDEKKHAKQTICLYCVFDTRYNNMLIAGSLVRL